MGGQYKPVFTSMKDNNYFIYMYITIISYKGTGCTFVHMEYGYDFCLIPFRFPSCTL